MWLRELDAFPDGPLVYYAERYPDAYAAACSDSGIVVWFVAAYAAARIELRAAVQGVVARYLGTLDDWILPDHAALRDARQRIATAIGSGRGADIPELDRVRALLDRTDRDAIDDPDELRRLSDSEAMYRSLWHLAESLERGEPVAFARHVYSIAIRVRGQLSFPYADTPEQRTREDDIDRALANVMRSSSDVVHVLETLRPGGPWR
jgi:hypothetical protein